MSKGKNNNEDVIAYYIAEGVDTVSEPKILKTNKSKNIVKFEAILQDGDKVNRNGRIYPTEVLKEAWRSPRVVEKLQRGTFVGENLHPKGDVQRLSDIDMLRASHIVKDYYFKENIVYGIVETINNELGNTMKSMILENDSKISFSLRAFGALSKKPGRQNIVEGPLNMICFDWISTPSHSASVLTKLIESTIIPITEQQATDFLLENSEVMNVLQDYLKDRRIKKTNIDLNGNTTIITEQEKLFVNVEKHVRDKYFKML